MYSQDKINISLQVYHQCGSVEGTQDSPNAEMQHLLARMDDMQMEIDILKETINV